MVLVQIYISPSNNGTYITVPASGTCSIRVLNIQYHDSSGAGNHRVIQIKSDVLTLPYSPMRFLTVVTHPIANVSVDSSHKEYHFKDLRVMGKIFIQVVDFATGIEPVNFTDLLLTLELEEMDSRP